MKWLVWWKHMPMYIQVEEMESWWNGKVSDTAIWLNQKLRNNKLIKWKVNEMTNWWNDKLTKQLIDKMTS